MSRPSTSFHPKTKASPSRDVSLAEASAKAGTRPGMTMRRHLRLASGNTAALLRADPIAVESIGHAMAEMHQRRRTCLDIGGVEDGEVAAVLAGAPHHREQPAVALGGVTAARDEDRLG